MSDSDKPPVIAAASAGNEGLQFQWRQIFDSLEQLVFVLDEDLRFLAVNRAGCRYLAQDEAVLLGRRCYEVMHRCPAPPANCPAGRILAGEATAAVEMEIATLGRVFKVWCTRLQDQAGRGSRIRVRPWRDDSSVIMS